MARRSAAASARPSSRGTRTSIRLTGPSAAVPGGLRAPAGRSTGPSRSAEPGSSRRLQQCGHRLRSAVDGGHVHGGRQADLVAGVELGLGVPDRIPADQRLHGRDRRFGDHGDHAAVGAAADQRRRGHPAAQRVLGGAQILAAEQRPASSSSAAP